MSYLYGLDPNEENRALDNANTHGADLSAIQPGFWQGTGSSMWENLKIGGLKTLMAGSYLRDPDEALGYAMSGYDKQMDEQMAAARTDMAQTAQRLTPNPLATGTGAQILGGLTQVLPLALGTGAIGGPVAAMGAVGAQQGVGDYQQSMLEGIDPDTAAKKALLTGAAAGIGVGVPMARAGAGLLANLAIGAGTNVALGAAQRAGTAAILENGGYTEQAKQYQWLDKNALMIDAVMGAAFGGIGHYMGHGVSPEQVDAALKMNEQQHAEIDGQPGIHRTPESRDAGADAFRSALDEVLTKDKAPDVGEFAAKMDLEPNPEAHAAYKEIDDTLRPELPKEEPEFQPPAAAVEDTFVTEKGSRYTVHEDGTTTRDKAARPEHPGEEGPQPRSQRTVYVDANDVNNLAELQAKGGARTTLAFDDKNQQIGVKYLDGKDVGKIEGRTVTKFSREPKEGMVPVEYWGDDKTVHFGNKITEVNGQKTNAAKPHDGTVEGMAKAGDVRPIESAEGRQILDSHPDLELPTGELHPDGTPVTAKFSDLMDQADKHIAGQQKEGALHDVAVACFLRG